MTLQDTFEFLCHYFWFVAVPRCSGGTPGKLHSNFLSLVTRLAVCDHADELLRPIALSRRSFFVLISHGYD